jgi:hypothetical protein
MTHPHPRALEAAASAMINMSALGPWQRLDNPEKSAALDQASAAVTAYLQSAPPEIRIGQFVIRHAGDRIWIGRTDGEGGEFATADVEAALAQFYRANF